MTQPRKAQINDLKAYWSTYIYTGTGGTTFTTLPGGFVTSSITQINGGDTNPLTRGIITTDTGGFCKLTNSDNGLSIDSGGQLFGRLTFSSGNYIVTYKTLIGGTETTTALPSGTYSIKLLFPEVMTFGEVPPDTFILSTSNVPLNPASNSISGDLFVSGNTTLGDANSDTLTVNARLNTNLIPSTDNVRSLGSSALRFNNIHSESFTARGDNTNTLYTIYDSNSIENSGSSFSIDSTNQISIGATNSTGVEIARSGIDTTIAGDLIVEQNLDVTGDVSFSSELLVQENLTVSGSLSLFTGDVTIIGNLTAGGLSFTDLVVTGSTQLGDSLSDTTILNGTVTLQSDALLTTTNSGNINLPNNINARFQIDGYSVDANVTAANLIELTDGSETILHTHPFVGSLVDVIYPLAIDGDDIISIPSASSLTDGYMSIADKIKLDSLGGVLASISNAGASVDTTGGDIEVVGPVGGDFSVVLNGDTVFASIAGVTTVDAPAGTVIIGPGSGSVEISANNESYIFLEDNGTGVLDIASSARVSLESPILTWVPSNSPGEVAGSGGFGGILYDVSSGAIREQVYDSSGNLAFTGVKNDTGSTATYVGPYTHETGGNLLFQQTRPTTDVVAPSTVIKAPRATSFATGTAGNKIGGNIDLIPGASRTEGTDQGGVVRIGMRPSIASWPAADSGLEFWIMNSGGDALSTKLAQIQEVSGQFSFLVGSMGAGIGRFIGGNSCSFYGFNGTNLGTASSTVDISGTYFHANISGDAYIYSSSATAGITAAEQVFLYSINRRNVDMGDGTIIRTRVAFPADTATTNATITTLTTFTPTARPSNYKVTVCCYNAALEVHTWSVTIPAILTGGAAFIIGGSPPIPEEVYDASLASCVLTIDLSTTTVRVRGTGIAATNITWTVTVIEVK